MLKTLLKSLEWIHKIASWIGSDKIYDYAKPIVEKEVRKIITLPDPKDEKEFEDVVITTTEILLKFILGIPLEK